MWNQTVLQKIIHEKMSDYSLVIASNREPYRHVFADGKHRIQREPGGLVTALDPVMQAAQGTWVALGSGEDDRQVLDEHGKVMLPPEHPAYALRRVFLNKEVLRGYYDGYSNEGLWPLCHIAYTRPVFREADWQSYLKANKVFADTILEEVGNQKAFVWIHDFHLILAGKYLKAANAANLITAFFLHIPWPNPEVFQICPQKKEILEGFLSYDMIGFQIRYHADNFLATVDRELETKIDREKISIWYQNRETLVRAFPVSVDFEAISNHAGSSEAQKAVKRIRHDYGIGKAKLVISVDRIDYTKGIPDRLRAIDLFFDKHPEFKEKIVFFQIGQPSRVHLERFRQLNNEINSLVDEINWKHSQGAWSPIIFTRSYIPYQNILALYRDAEVCIVSALHDGMNLVAKEFIAARSNATGTLILSRFAGSARELPEAILINPYDTESFAGAIYEALTLSPEDKQKKMQKMRETIAQQNIYRWVGKVLSQLLKFEFQEE